MRLLVSTSGAVVTEALHDSLTILDGADILVEGGTIKSIQPSRDLVEEFDLSENVHHDLQFMDVGSRAIVPGLIDAHTHLIWSGDRSDEVGKRLRGNVLP